MGIVNRRNAMLGWVAWQVGKRVLKKRAREAVPGTVEGTRRPNLAAIILAALAAAGAFLWFWRRGDDEDEPLT